MELATYFKSVLDQDRCPVVICNLEHIILYMNPVAVERYKKRGGASLIGKNLLDCHNERSKKLIEQVLDWFRVSPEHNIMHTFYNERENKDVYMVALRNDEGTLIGYYEKHECRNKESGRAYDF